MVQCLSLVLCNVVDDVGTFILESSKDPCNRGHHDVITPRVNASHYLDLDFTPHNTDDQTEDIFKFS